MLPRTGGSAVAWAKGQAENNVYWRPGLCLKFTRMCFNVAARYPSAETGWYATKRRHTSWPPPPGVPVWWTNGRYGHVVVSAGGGYCYSTDYPYVGRIRKVRIKDITAAWGQRYRGWSEDINDVRVWKPTLSAGSIARATLRRGSPPNGKLLKRAVAAEVGRGSMNLLTSKLGRSFRKQYRKVQAEYLGRKTTDGLDGIPALGSLRWLGNRRDFWVKP